MRDDGEIAEAASIVVGTLCTQPKRTAKPVTATAA